MSAKRFLLLHRAAEIVPARYSSTLEHFDTTLTAPVVATFRGLPNATL
jgi:hypothetical protein